MAPSEKTLVALLIVSIFSGELSVSVTGMPYPEMSTVSTQVVNEAINEVPVASAMEIVEEIAQGDVPMENIAVAQEGLPVDKVPITQGSLPVEPVPIAQEVLPTEKVPIVEEVVPVDNVPIAQGELSLEKVPSGQTVEQVPKLAGIESMDNAPALDSAVPTDPSLERLAKLLSFKSVDPAPAPATAVQVAESVANAPSVQTVEPLANVPSSDSADKSPALNKVVAEPLDKFPEFQAMEPMDTARDVPEGEVHIQEGMAPAEIPSIEVGSIQPWDSVEEAREAASQLAYQQFLGIDPLTFAMSEMNNFDEESENDRHYVKKRILQLSSEERAINQAYSENIEQREAERIRRKSLAIMRTP